MESLRDQYDDGLPYDLIATDQRYPSPENGTALCLSGGGFRAALFHLGALWYLNETGLLNSFDRITSVSGGAITAARLGLVWNSLDFDTETSVASNFRELVANPILRFTRTTVDWPGAFCMRAGLRYIFNPYRFALDRILLKGANLQDLPDSPRFVFNATNVQSGSLWRFMKPRMRDWRVGDVHEPKTRLSFTVMASSAYPPFLSPMIMRLAPNRFEENSGQDLGAAEFQRLIYLTDGGVYDNLGIETSWKKYATVLISDAGWPADPDPHPGLLMINHTMRAVALMNSSFIELRKRQVINSFKIMHDAKTRGETPVSKQTRMFGRDGAYWGIHTAEEKLVNALEQKLDEGKISKAARTPTRLAAVNRRRQRELVDLGYLNASISVRRYLRPDLPEPSHPPFDALAI